MKKKIAKKKKKTCNHNWVGYGSWAYTSTRHCTKCGLTISIPIE
jgi:hypothetical protein